MGSKCLLVYRGTKWLIFLWMKSPVAPCSHGHKVKNILVHVKSDYAAELSAGRAKKWCSENLIQTVHSVPHVPDDNKLIETYVKLVKKLARVAAFESGVPADFWFWFCQIACHVINVSPRACLVDRKSESDFVIFGSGSAKSLVMLSMYRRKTRLIRHHMSPPLDDLHRSMS